MISRLLISTLFPYTTLFRSGLTNQIALFSTVHVLGLDDGYKDSLPKHAVAFAAEFARKPEVWKAVRDRKSTRLNSSHVEISYAVFCLKKKKKKKKRK